MGSCNLCFERLTLKLMACCCCWGTQFHFLHAFLILILFSLSTQINIELDTNCSSDRMDGNRMLSEITVMRKQTQRRGVHDPSGQSIGVQ